MARKQFAPSGFGSGPSAAVPSEEILKDLCDTRTALNRVEVAIFEMKQAQTHTNGLLEQIHQAMLELVTVVREQADLTRAGIDEAQGFRSDMAAHRAAVEADTAARGPR